MPVDERYVCLTVKREVHERIKKLANELDEPMTKVIERAIELLEKANELLSGAR